MRYLLAFVLAFTPLSTNAADDTREGGRADGLARETADPQDGTGEAADGSESGEPGSEIPKKANEMVLAAFLQASLVPALDMAPVTEEFEALPDPERAAAAREWDAAMGNADALETLRSSLLGGTVGEVEANVRSLAGQLGVPGPETEMLVKRYTRILDRAAEGGLSKDPDTGEMKDAEGKEVSKEEWEQAYAPPVSGESRARIQAMLKDPFGRNGGPGSLTPGGGVFGGAGRMPKPGELGHASDYKPQYRGAVGGKVPGRVPGGTPAEEGKQGGEGALALSPDAKIASFAALEQVSPKVAERMLPDVRDAYGSKAEQASADWLASAKADSLALGKDQKGLIGKGMRALGAKQAEKVDALISERDAISAETDPAKRALLRAEWQEKVHDLMSGPQWRQSPEMQTAKDARGSYNKFIRTHMRGFDDGSQFRASEVGRPKYAFGGPVLTIDTQNTPTGKTLRGFAAEDSDGSKRFESFDRNVVVESFKSANGRTMGRFMRPIGDPDTGVYRAFDADFKPLGTTVDMKMIGRMPKGERAGAVRDMAVTLAGKDKKGRINTKRAGPIEQFLTVAADHTDHRESVQVYAEGGQMVAQAMDNDGRGYREFTGRFRKLPEGQEYGSYDQGLYVSVAHHRMDGKGQIRPGKPVEIERFVGRNVRDQFRASTELRGNWLVGYSVETDHEALRLRRGADGKERKVKTIDRGTVVESEHSGIVGSTYKGAYKTVKGGVQVVVGGGGRLILTPVAYGLAEITGGDGGAAAGHMLEGAKNSVLKNAASVELGRLYGGDNYEQGARDLGIDTKRKHTPADYFPDDSNQAKLAKYYWDKAAEIMRQEQLGEGSHEWRDGYIHRPMAALPWTERQIVIARDLCTNDRMNGTQHVNRVSGVTSSGKEIADVEHVYSGAALSDTFGFAGEGVNYLSSVGWDLIISPARKYASGARGEDFWRGLEYDVDQFEGVDQWGGDFAMPQ